MTREEIQTAVRTTIAVLTRIAKRTRTQADDLMAAILTSSEDRLTTAVLKLVENQAGKPTDEQIAKALDEVGIKV